jgi:hypothetical protein
MKTKISKQGQVQRQTGNQMKVKSTNSQPTIRGLTPAIQLLEISSRIVLIKQLQISF